jgi:Aromatic ring hydroxylase
MTIKTYEEYLDRLKRMKKNIYIDGEKVDRMDERLQGQIRVIRETYDRANDPEFEDVCTATSHLTGEKINRFCHIHQSKEDLLKKQRMTRLLCHRTGGCIMRCMGIDTHTRVANLLYRSVWPAHLRLWQNTTGWIDLRRCMEFKERMIETGF